MRNQLLERVILPLGDWLTGASFMRSLRGLRACVRLSEPELEELQRKRLAATLDHAVAHSPYYRPYATLAEQDPIGRLKAFPVLDKATLNREQLALLTCDPAHLLPQSSSGSSGVRSQVYWSKEEQSQHRATQILWWEWAGYRLGMPIVQTGITPKRGKLKRIKDFLLATYYLQAFAHIEKDVLKALSWAKRKPVVFLGGYASSLYVISKMALENGQTPKFSGAVSWGDKLFDHYKQQINSAFGVQICETYGTAEGMMIAAQKDLPYLYQMSPLVYLELLDDEGCEVPDGEMGHVVVTSLVARGMPLIRYKIGDLAIKLPRAAYPEKRELALPLLQKVVGRDTDIVKTRSGKFMVVHTFTGIVEHIPALLQFCVIQRHLDGITIQYIADPATFEPAVLEHIRNSIQGYLKEASFHIEFEAVSYIPPTPSGKPQIIQSFLHQEA